MNYKKFKNYFIAILLIILISFFQISFIQALFAPINSLNIPLTLIILFVVFIKYENTLLFSFISGIVIGLMSYGRFGIDAMSFLTIAIFAHMLFNNFFTSASLYSLILIGIISYILHYFMLIILTSFYHSIKIFPLALANFINIKIFFQYIFINTIFLAILYLLYIKFFKKFNQLKA